MKIIEGIIVEDLNCYICGRNIEDNGGYMGEINYEYICTSGDNESQECWWNHIENYLRESYDLSDAVEVKEKEEE